MFETQDSKCRCGKLKFLGTVLLNLVTLSVTLFLFEKYICSSGTNIHNPLSRSQFYSRPLVSLYILQKGCGYHLDLLIVAIMLGVCSIMGLPWFVAATVLSISHVNSLKVESGCSAPGEQPKFLGIREQRVTGIMIFVLMGCSVFMTSVLKVSFFYMCFLHIYCLLVQQMSC